MQWYNRKKQTKKQKFDEEMKATGGLDALNPTRRGFMSTAGSVAIGAMGVAGANTLVALNNGAKADGDPIPVGAMLPITGWGADDARNFQYGIELAIEEINEYGGILGRPLELHIEDTKEITAETVTSAARRLIDRHNVHAIINGYNTVSVRAEYDTVADAGIPYIHDNTQYGHQIAVRDNPDRFYCIFQDDPSEYYYGPGLIHFLDELERTGKWKRPNNKIALFSGSIDYATTIAGGIRDTAPLFGWDLVIDDMVTQPVDDWGPSLVKSRAEAPALIAATHGFHVHEPAPSRRIPAAKREDAGATVTACHRPTGHGRRQGIKKHVDDTVRRFCVRRDDGRRIYRVDQRSFRGMDMHRAVGPRIRRHRAARQG